MAITASATRTDPLRNFKFQVEIVPNGNALRTYPKSLGKLGFASMSGLSVNNDLLAYREGGMNTHTHKMVGLSDFNAVSFMRGVFSEGDEMWRWQQFIHSWQSGVPGGNAGSSGNGDYRCTINVRVYDHPVTSDAYSYVTDAANPPDTLAKPGDVKLMVRMYNCWPGVFSFGGLSAGDSGLLVQEMTVHHEGFVVAWNNTDAGRLGLPQEFRS